jgi:ferredoxin
MVDDDKVTLTLFNATGQEIDSFSVRRGMNVWVALRKRGVAIGSACSGVGVCGACHVKITPLGEGFSPANEFEKRTLEKNHTPEAERLSCLCRAFTSLHIQASYW